MVGGRPGDRVSPSRPSSSTTGPRATWATGSGGFDLTVLDANRKVVFQKHKNPAPSPKSTFNLGDEDPAGAVRRAAMDALTTIRGQEVPTFKALAKFVRDGVDRNAAIAALKKIPSAYWPDDELQSLADVLIA